MPTRNEQLADLLSLTAHSISQLSEALTTFSFELMASDDPAARIASRRMVSRVSAIQSTFDQKWRLLSAAAGIASSMPGLALEMSTRSSPEDPGSDETARGES